MGSDNLYWIILLILSFILGMLFFRSARTEKANDLGLYVIITKVSAENKVPRIMYDTNTIVHAVAVARMQRIVIARELINSGEDSDEVKKIFMYPIARNIGAFEDDVKYLDVDSSMLRKTMFPDLSFKGVALGFRDD